MSAINQALRVNSPPASITGESKDQEIRCNDQLICFSSAVQERFKLDQDERMRFTRLYEFESQNLTQLNAVQSVFNRMKGFMACSEWDYIHNLLARKGEFVLETHYNDEVHRNELSNKASNLAKFILNYLITLNAICTGQNTRRISEYQWTHHRMHELTLDAVLDKAPNGNGTDLVNVELMDIVASFRKTLSEYQDEAITLYNLRKKQMPDELAKECDEMAKISMEFLRTPPKESSIDPAKFVGDVNEVYEKLLNLRSEYDKLYNFDTVQTYLFDI